MFNSNYEPESIDELTPAVTVLEARQKVKYHEKMVQSSNFDINTETGRYDWECLNYYNQIILKSGLKRNNQLL